MSALASRPVDDKARLLQQRGVFQTVYDFVGAPLRMVVLPDHWSRRLGLSSLEDERLRAILPVLRGRLLDIGAGTNRLVQLHGNGVGVDVHDWGGGAVVVEDTRHLPFAAGEFDTVTFVACLNHIPYRDEALVEARRVLRPGGRLVVTMIGPWIGGVGHKLWWYSEDKHRHVDEHELMGMAPEHVISLIGKAGFSDVQHSRFLYQLNHLFVARA
jgi:SAM-dependent methyltransferase